MVTLVLSSLIKNLRRGVKVRDPAHVSLHVLVVSEPQVRPFSVVETSDFTETITKKQGYIRAEQQTS